VGLFIGILGATLAPVAFAADATSGTSDQLQLQEILVTATRRSESVDKVPISITALGASDLAVANIKNIDDLQQLVPSLQFAAPNGFTSAFTTIAIRGFNSNTGPTTVGIYVDDVPISSRLSGYTNQGSAYPYVFDLNRVEVARGPQGTLFGAGAEAGTVRFITNQPSFTEFTASTHGELAQTEGGRQSYEIGGAAGGPVNDGIAYRVSVWNRQDGGYIDRVDPATGNVVDAMTNTAHKFVARGALAFKLGSDFVLTPSVHYQKWTQDDAPRFNAAFSDADAGIFHNSQLIPETWTDKWTASELKLDGHLPFAQLTAMASYFDREVDQLLDQSEFVCPFLLLGPGDTPGCGNPLGIGYPSQRWQAVVTPTGLKVIASTAEVRLTSNDPNARLSWVAGVFYDHRVQNDFQTSFGLLTPAISNSKSMQLQAQGYCGTAAVPCGMFQDQHETFTDEQIAGYAQLDFHVTQALTLTVGERYGHVKVTVQEASDPGLAAVYGASATVVTASTENPSTPHVGVSYQVNADNLLYASWGKGFRIGGANAPVPPTCPQVVPETYNPDTVESYEIGAKNRLFEGRVQVNTSLYRATWNDIQQYASLPCGPFAYSTNAGSAISRGGELSIQAILTPRVRTMLNVSYVDAYYSENGYDKLGNLLVNEGSKVGILPQVNPPWTVNLQLQYDQPLDNGSRWYAWGDFNYISQSPGPFITQVQNSSNYYPLAVPDPATRLFNFRLGYALKSLDASVYLNNAFNTTPWLSKYQGVGISNFIQYTTFRPRTLGAALTYTF
jgi:outer membrane receptor protein involved in Fe transport